MHDYERMAEELRVATENLTNRKKAPAKKPEKGVPWEAKVIDGEYFVPLRQVADLLASNNSLPAVRKGIEARCLAQSDRKKRGI